MSTSVIEPGTRLAGRYRLDDRVSEAGGSTFWKATDEILARPVAVLTFAPGFPRVSEVVTAARAASRLTDPRLTQVFDADDSGERAYVVSEWVTGDTLEDLLAQGPMKADRAATFLLEAAEALTSAHGSGLAHLCLTPHNLVWTSGGTVKLTGLGVEAVLAASASDTPAQDDTYGLGRMLYAALTGHWCGTEPSALPAAPSGPDGQPLGPGQVHAGVPHNVDAIVCRALHLRNAQEPLSTPSAFADALAQVPRSPLPFVPLVGSTPPAVVARPDTSELPNVPTSAQTVPDRARTRGVPAARHAAGRPDTVSKPMLAAIAVIVLVVVAIGGWGLTRIGGDGPDKDPDASTTPIARKSPNTLEPIRASAYNPDSRAIQDAEKAVDHSESSAWTTNYYFDDHFGNLRKDIGLLLDMGHPVTVDKVRLIMPAAGTSGVVELRIGDSGKAGMTKAATGDASGTFELNGGQAKGRYVMLRFTKLPNIGQYKIKVSDVKVYGTG